MYHVRHRMYHPTLGLWLQRDPLGYVDGMSLYEYNSSTPGNGLDPYGLDRLQWEGKPEHVSTIKKHWNEAKRQAKGSMKQRMERMDDGKGKTTRIKVVSGKQRIIVGGYDSGRLNVEDIEAFPDKGPATKASKTAHEIVEQHAKQVNKQPNRRTGKGVGPHGDAAHAEGVKAEEAVTGWKRGEMKYAGKNSDGKDVFITPYEREVKGSKPPKAEKREVVYIIDASGKMQVVEQSPVKQSQGAQTEKEK